MSRNQIVTAGFIFLMGLIALFNYWTARLLTEDSRTAGPAAGAAATASARAAARVSQAEEPKRYPLIPDDPAKYGIISVSELQMPREQMEWDAFMQKAIIQSGILETPEGGQAVAEMNTSEQKFEDTAQRVEREIEFFSNQARENPADEYSRDRLQTLYKLKALGKVLKKKVTTLPQAKDLPLPTHAVDEAPPGQDDKGSVPAGEPVLLPGNAVKDE